MKALLASLLAACALAGTQTHYLIEADSTTMIAVDLDTGDETAFESTGQVLTLTTTELDDGENIMFCFDAVVPDAGEDVFFGFGVEWTNGEEYIEGVDLDGAFVLNDMDGGAETFPFDDFFSVIEDGDQSTVWSVADEPTEPAFSCEEGVCSGNVCITRALTEADHFDLPFVDGTQFLSYYLGGSFIGYNQSGAMSLGLALFSAAGAALTLI